MDSRRFDKLTRALGSLERRQVLVLLPATLAAVLARHEAADARRTRKQRKQERERRQRKRKNRLRRLNVVRCRSVGGRKVRCYRTEVCCDRERSNLAGCARRGFATCCRASENSSYGFTSDYRCCPTPAEGQNGACPDAYPVCCQGGCCPAGSDCSDLTGCLQFSDESIARHVVRPV
jgi:hypothetical protein